MAFDQSPITRRAALKSVAGLAAGLALRPRPLWAEDGRLPSGLLSVAPITKPIPSTGEQLPVVGAGTVWESWAEPAQVREFLNEIVRAGAKLIHTKPWYTDGKAIANIGTVAAELGIRDKLFVAVQAIGDKETFEQTKQQLGTIEVAEDLPLPLLRELKQAKQIRYIAGGPNQIEEGIDFCFLWGNNYSILNREAEEEILPLAKDKGVAVIAMIPFGSRSGAKEYFGTFGSRPIPPWAAELGITSWAQFALKYLVSHPAVVSCTPGTTKLKHLVDNLGAAQGQLPDEATRRKMAALIDAR